MGFDRFNLVQDVTDFKKIDQVASEINQEDKRQPNAIDQFCET